MLVATPQLGNRKMHRLDVSYASFAPHSFNVRPQISI